MMDLEQLRDSFLDRAGYDEERSSSMVRVSIMTMWRSAALMLPVLAIGVSAPASPRPSNPDEELLKQARIGTDGPDLLQYFRQRTVNESERQRILQLIRELGSEVYAVRDRAVGDLIEIGLPAVGLLRAGLSDSDVEIARRCERCLKKIEGDVPIAKRSAAAARLLAVRKPQGAAAVLLAYLPFADDEIVAEELRDALAGVALFDGRLDPALESSLADPLAIRRGAAAVALIRSGAPAAIASGRRALADKDPEVRLRTAIALVTYAKDREAVPKMIGLLAELPQSAASRIEEVLMRLAGDTAPVVSLGDDDAARQKCRDTWLAWWEQNGAKIELARPMVRRRPWVTRSSSCATGTGKRGR
jgi:hypothetical protein